MNTKNEINVNEEKVSNGTFKDSAVKLFKKLGKRWFIDAFSGMAQGLFVTLIAGLIVKQLGTLIGNNGVGKSIVNIGLLAMALTGAGIGAGIANALKANKLVIFAAIIAGMVGANADLFLSGKMFAWPITSIKIGDPIGAYLASLIAVEVGIFLTGKTKLDIIVLPISMILISLIVTKIFCPGIIEFTKNLGLAIEKATQLKPFTMGVVLAVSMGILLTLPTSSAAICIALQLGGIAGGAAVVGCCCQMVGFAVMSYRENKVSGLIAQGLGTSMLQIPNIMKKPILIVPPIIASAILGPIATVLFKLQCDFRGSGMGTSGFVGPLMIIEGSKGHLNGFTIAVAIILLCFLLPALICWLLSEFFRKKNLIKFGDLKL